MWAWILGFALAGGDFVDQMDDGSPEVPAMIRNGGPRPFLASPNKEPRLQPRIPWAPTEDEFDIVAQVIGRRQVQREGSVPYLTPSVQDQVEQSKGFADLHVHQFSELGFGMRVVYGGSAPCDGEWHGIGQNIVRMLMVAPSMLEDDLMSDLLPHCPAADMPSADGWTHEQYSAADLKSAHDHGLNLIVQYAVNNPILCAITRRFGDALNESCADVANIDRQLAASWRFDQLHPWYTIALDPIDAAQAMSRGELAVLLGVEASDFFAGPGRGGILGADGLAGRYRHREGCDPRYDRAPTNGVLEEFGRWTKSECGLARAAVRHVDIRGVRSIFPTHEWNSPMGGAAVQHVDLFQPGYAIVMHSGAPQKLGIVQVGGAFADFASERDDFDKWPTPVEVARDPTLNTEYPRSQQGMTPMGRALLRAARDANIIVDIGHSSERGAYETLRLSQLWHLDPLEEAPMLLSSHVTPRSTALGHPMDHEYYIGDGLLDAMTAYSSETGRIAMGYRTAGVAVRSVVNGLVGERNCMTGADGECWSEDGKQPLADGNSSSMLQNYHKLQASRMPVGFGTDMNGGAGQVGPRSCMVREYDPERKASHWEEGPCPKMCEGANCTRYARKGLATVAEAPYLAADMRCLYDRNRVQGDCAPAFQADAGVSPFEFACANMQPGSPMEPLCRSAPETVLAWAGRREAHSTHGAPAVVLTREERPVYAKSGFRPAEQQMTLDTLQRALGTSTIAGIQVTPTGDIVIPQKKSARLALRELRRKGLLGARCTPLKEIVEGEEETGGGP